MMLPDADNIRQYIIHEVDEGDTQAIAWELKGKNPEGEPEFYDVNTAVYDIFKRQQTEISYSTGDLRGCTMLAIVSRKGFYISHYWESISFDTSKEDYKDMWDSYKTQEGIFENTVLRGLEKGIKEKGQVVQVSLKNYIKDLDDQHIRAYLIRPSTHGKEDETDKNQGYRKEWDKIQDKVSEYFPSLKAPGMWEEILYDVVDDEELLNTERGKLLFKYDPKHRTERGKTYQRVMLWSETTEVHSDEWELDRLI